MKMAVFSMVSVFRGSPHLGPLPGFLASCWLLAGFLLASCWPLAGLLLASCWPLASCWLLLASCWPLATFLLATSFPTKISLENRFFTRLAKLVTSLHENGCFSMVSVIRGVPPIWGLFLASWPLAGLLASCWPLAGFLLASCWPLAGLLLATSFPTKISLENRFFTRLAKLVNSLHENECFSMVSVFRGVPPHLGPLPGLLASCWPLASCWLLAGL